MKLATALHELFHVLEKPVRGETVRRQLLPIACCAGQMRETLLLGLRDVGFVAGVTIGNQRPGEVFPKHTARHLAGSRRVKLKVNELLRAMHPVKCREPNESLQVEWYFTR